MTTRRPTRSSRHNWRTLPAGQIFAFTFGDPGPWGSPEAFAAAYDDYRDQVLGSFPETGEFDRPPQMAVRMFDRDPVVVSAAARFWATYLERDRLVTTRRSAWPTCDPRHLDLPAREVWRVQALDRVDRMIERARDIASHPAEGATFAEQWGDLPDPQLWSLGEDEWLDA